LLVEIISRGLPHAIGRQPISTIIKLSQTIIRDLIQHPQIIRIAADTWQNLNPYLFRQ
jgi:hypothetical protein